MSTLLPSPLTFTSPPSISPFRRHRPPPKISLPRRRHPSRGATMLDNPSTSYASALSSLSQSNNTLDATMSDLDTIKAIFSDPSIPSFFTNPTFPDAAKLDLIREIAAAADLQPHTLNFLCILLDMRRIDLVDEIVKEFGDCYNEITGTAVAVVASVVRIEERQLGLIARAVQRLTGARNVRIRTEIDAGLVAGFTIRYGNSGSKLIDLSVKKQLEEIAERMDLSSVVMA